MAHLAADAAIDLAPVADAPPFGAGTIGVVALDGRALTLADAPAVPTDR